jgi:excinuclease ABC subunit A
MDHIRIEGARVHNLKNLNVVIPRDQIVVLTGVSGSGKSSLAFDTIYAEGQRRYLDSISPYGRQLLGPIERADIDLIEGLSPAIAVRQQPLRESVRSTVGTLTEIHDYLRVLYAHVGRAHCPQCGKRIQVHTVQQIVDTVMNLPEGTRILVLAPIAGEQKDREHELEELLRSGFIRVAIEGEVCELTDVVDRALRSCSRLELVVDRLIVRDGVAKRLADSIEVALSRGHETVHIGMPQEKGREPLRFTRRFACVDCGIPFPQVTPQLFSFNNPEGACPSCEGLGVVLAAGRALRERSAEVCGACGGSRLRSQSLCVTIGGLSVSALTAMPVTQSMQVLRDLELSGDEAVLAEQLLRELDERLTALARMDLGYISLDRSSDSLSGGESQRVRLAKHLGSRLAGVIYILDEPTIGLHPADTARLLDILRDLRGAGNSVLVVEHDRDVVLAADHVIDLGPGSGIAGGKIVAQGTPQQIAQSPSSVTGQYLAAERRISRSGPRDHEFRGNIELKNVHDHNLKNIDVRFPIGRFTCVTGVSGAGKSSLVVNCLYRRARAWLEHPKQRGTAELSGFESFKRVLYVDQGPIGRSARSNPATYTGALDPVRELFARLPEARARGYDSGRFSTNVKGGRCEACMGEGVRRVEMHFLPDVAVTCDVCEGRRYNRETLEIRYKGANIADVLELTVVEALDFLGNVPLVHQRLESLWSVGLGYLRLGHPATMLSGGEAQRVKLARELGKTVSGQTLYLFDEPTTGLHFDEVARLMETLDRLLDAGHTVVAIEHNMDLVKCADFIIDLGPGGGADGGRIVAQGTPKEVRRVTESLTGQALKRVLSPFS